MNSKNEALRLAAIRELLDRGYGKATQPIAGELNSPSILVITESEAKY